jgi:energy-coupling factor transport system permease protein
MTAVAARFDRVNPVARLLATLPLVVGLLLTLDPVSAGAALVLEAVLLPLTGIRPGRFWRVTLPVWIAAPLGAVTVLLYGRASGATWLQFGIVHVTEGSAQLALATLLRVLAIALPAIVLFASVDPTDLADGLGQVLRLPARFVLGALAGLRMLALVGDDWRAIGLARRARGLGDRRGPSGLLRRAFALLVLALRRGTALATAMEARGFGGATPRTWARPSRFGRAEWTLLALGLLVAVVATAAAIGAGTWRFAGA